MSQLPLPDGDPGQGGPLDFPTTIDEDKVDYSAVLRYRPNDDAMYYVSVSEAFRSGGYSSAVIFSQEALEPYGPETLRSYEIGLKLSLADNRVRFNASAFFYDYEDFQATFVRATEASARLAERWRRRDQGPRGVARLAADPRTYDQCGAEPARHRDRRDGRGAAAARRRAGLHHRGQRDPERPAVSFNGRIRYEWPMGATLAIAAQTDFNYVDEHFLEPNNREYLSEDGYFLANARVSLLSQGGPWEVSAWVKNLGDEEYRTAAQDLALSLGFSEIVMGVPLTWGVDFEYRF